MIDGDLTWRRLHSLVRGLPRHCATARSVIGEDSAWDVSEHLMATAVDALNVGNWQRSGGKGRRPRRVPRPGVGHDRKIGHTERNPEQVVAYLDQFRPRRAEPSPSS